MSGAALSPLLAIEAVAKPIANPVSATVAANSSSNNIPLSITGGAPTSVAVTSGPSNGTATPSGTDIYYTPNGGYSGSDAFDYTASNASGTSSPALVSITVSPPPFTPVTHTYTSGSGTETVPSGASYVQITVCGPGGSGSTYEKVGSVNPAGGGAGGEALKDLVAVTGGETMSYAVGTPGAQVVSSGEAGIAGTASTVSGALAGGAVSMTANGGAGGGIEAGGGGAGGTASGGDTNTTGGAGSGTGLYPGGTNASGIGNGGDGFPGGPSGPGSAAEISFAYT